MKKTKSGKEKPTMRYRMNQWKKRGIAVLVSVMILLGTVGMAIPAYAADKSVLQASTSQVEQMDVSGYTDESVALLESALNSSVQVIGDDGASSSRVNNHVAMLDMVIGALIAKKDDNILISGNYTIEGILRQAFSDNASMGNEAINQPMELIVEKDEITLRLKFSSLTVPGQGQGYLSQLSYLSNWDGMFSEMTDTQYKAFQVCTVEEYYQGVYDSFNDPKTGTDATVKGQLYPKCLTMPVDYKDTEVWVKVYIPIMESISAGGGTQYARLQMNWNTLTWVEPNKSALDAAVKQLAQLQETVLAADYTQEMVNLLEQARVTGKYIQNSTDISQSQVDAMTQALNSVANLFADADKQYLYDMIQLAGNYTTSDYTDTYVTKMKELIRDAQEVYHNVFATQTQVNEQYALLLQAISNAQKKDTSAVTSPSTTTPAPPSNTTPTTPSTGGGNDKLDKNNLADGVYAITGKMVKTDKSTASMSDDAINHTVKLTVKKGKYKITLRFMGLNINGSYGYLSKMRYYKTGYTLDNYGSPQGTTKAVTVDSWQLDSDGVRFSDIYGTDYPRQVTFSLISEAVDDGYVPLQVYIPIMEAISAGTGTQPVFLYLNWSTLKSKTENDGDLEDKQDNNNSNHNSSTPSTGSSFIANSLLTNGHSSITGRSTSLKNSITGSVSENSISNLLRADAGLSENTESLSETLLSQTPITEVQSVVTDTTSVGGSAKASNPAAIPTVISVLMAAAGFLFKLKGRGGL